ncbi:hypothetical protein HYW60_01110 [Candidatus Kaiserbacteria bacterium]|nr:hypothetical protein [Candidatus Kaiserbacteria bacterium]
MAQVRTLREITHEARTALSVIRLTVETLLTREPAEEARAELETILKQVDRLAEIADEISRAKR